MNPQLTKKVLIGSALVSVLLAAGLGALFALTPKVKKPGFVEGRPLLQNDDELFTDPQLGIQFAPPGNWSMQARSTESPHEHKPERMIVKFKRLIPGLEVAWLRVSVADVPEDQPLAELLRKRKLPEADWKVIGQIEEGFSVANRPAARITFGGPLDPDQKGKRDFTSEVVAVRRGTQVFYFAGTYVTADPKGQKRIRTSLETVSLDRERFAPEH